MPEVSIVIKTNMVGKPIIGEAIVRTTTLGREDTVEEVIDAAKKVRDFIAKFESKEK